MGLTLGKVLMANLDSFGWRQCMPHAPYRAKSKKKKEKEFFKIKLIAPLFNNNKNKFV